MSRKDTRKGGGHKCEREHTLELKGVHSAFALQKILRGGPLIRGLQRRTFLKKREIAAKTAGDAKHRIGSISRLGAAEVCRHEKGLIVRKGKPSRNERRESAWKRAVICIRKTTRSVSNRAGGFALLFVFPIRQLRLRYFFIMPDDYCHGAFFRR